VLASDLTTWSGYHSYMDQQQKFATDLKSAWQVENLDDTSVPIRVIWNVFIFIRQTRIDAAVHNL